MSKPRGEEEGGLSQPPNRCWQDVLVYTTLGIEDVPRFSKGATEGLSLADVQAPGGEGLGTNTKQGHACEKREASGGEAG